MCTICACMFICVIPCIDDTRRDLKIISNFCYLYSLYFKDFFIIAWSVLETSIELWALSVATSEAQARPGEWGFKDRFSALVLAFPDAPSHVQLHVCICLHTYTVYTCVYIYIHMCMKHTCTYKYLFTSICTYTHKVPALSNKELPQLCQGLWFC